jgi:hypothetical protein
MICASLYYHIIGDDMKIETLLIRFAIAAVITLPALYAASESSRHRKVADTARQTELQLASLNPFLATLPEEKQQAIIENLTPAYFGKYQPDVRSKADVVETGKILAEVASFVTKIKAAFS